MRKRIPRRLRRNARGIPFVVRFKDRLTVDDAVALRNHFEWAMRHGKPLIVDKSVEIINLRRRT